MTKKFEDFRSSGSEFGILLCPKLVDDFVYFVYREYVSVNG